MSDQAGNFFTTARNIDLSNGLNQKVFTDIVDANDPNDYYRFILRGRSSVSALINSSIGNANFELYGENPATGQRNLLNSGVNPGTTADFSSQELEAGIYYIRVFPGNNSVASNYSLTLKTQTLQSTQILWRETSSLGVNQVWQMGGANMAVAIAPATAIPDVPINWELAGIADFNLDGVSDLVWREAANGFTVIWYMGGVNNASAIATAVLPQVTGNWQLAGMADFNADRRIDLVWREAASGNTLIWYMGGDNGATPLYGNLLSNVPGNWQLAGVADFNQDTRPDLLWRETTHRTGSNILWYMGGEQGTTILSSTSILTVPTNWRVESLLDYNADGYTDIFWRESASGISQVWFMGGTNGAQAISSALLPQVAANWKAIAFSQFTTPAPADVPGNSSGDALNIGNLSNATFRESVGGRDTADVYRFTVQERSELKLEDSGFGDKTVLLLNGSEQEVGRTTASASFGTLAPKIPLKTLNTILNPGTYYIRVTANSSSSPVDYNLTLSMTAAPEIYKYSFTYYYNGNNNQADYYMGYVYGLRDRYTTNSWFDPNSGNNETGTNGRYLIQSQTLVTGAEANNSNLGKVFVDRYYDIDQGNQSYVPNNSTTAIGSSYLGSEKGFLRNQTDIFHDFGVDAIEFDALTDIRATSFDIVQGTAQPGESVTVKVRLEDLTNAAIVTSNIKVSFYLSTDSSITTGDALLGTYDVNFNGGRSSNELTYSFQLPTLNHPIWQTSGRFQIGVMVDSNSAISEANEANNSNRGQGLDLDNLQVNLPIQKYNFTYYFNGTNQGAQDSYNGYFYANAKTYSTGQWIDPKSSNNETGFNGKYLITEVATAGTTTDLGKIFVSNYFNQENNTNYRPLYFSQGKTSGTAGLGSEFDYIDNDRSIDNDFGADSAEYDVMYHKYSFEYFYNGTDRSADYYTGWVIAKAGLYTTDAQYQWIDPNPTNNETGLNGRYKITAWDRNATVADVGKVYIDRYFDSQTQESFTPHKFASQQASGSNFLGSESDFIQVSGLITQNDQNNDFGQDKIVFNTPWQPPIDAVYNNTLGTSTTGYVRRNGGTPHVFRTYQSGAAIYWTRQYGAVLVNAAMNPVYQATGGADGWLGAPTAAETTWNGGRRSNFAAGYIFGTPERGYRTYRSAETPWEIEGNAVYPSVSATLGQATNNWMAAFTSPQGTTGYFRTYSSGGTIHWAAKYGAVALANYIEAAYRSTGGSGGFLGYATRAEYAWNNGRRVDFEGGYIFSNGQTAQAYYPNEAAEVKAIQVNRPTAGLTVGQSYDITWTDNLPENVEITLYKGTQALKTIANNTLSDGIESWTVPTDLTVGNDYYFQIKSKTRGVTGNSQVFSISPIDTAGKYPSSARDITINNAPLAISEWVSGTDLRDVYRFTLTQRSNVLLDLNTQTGATGAVFYGNSNDEYNFGTQLYDGPASPIQSLIIDADTERYYGVLEAGTYFMEIGARSDMNGNYMSSYYNFTVTANPVPTVQVTSPNNGDVLNFGTTVSINWIDNFNDNVRIELYKDNQFYSTIANSVSSTGSYNWTIPTNIPTGSNYKIRIVNVNNASVQDLSDQPFSLKSGFNIQFDYRFDTNNWFTLERRAALEIAADIWERIILDEFADTSIGTNIPFVRNPQTDLSNLWQTDLVIDDLLIFAGARSITSGALADGGASGYYNNDTRYTGNDFEPRVGTISFDTNTNWFFDRTPDTQDDIPFDRFDFISVAIHEIGHVLGFSRGLTAFDNWVINDQFTGTNAQQVNGGRAIPLQIGGGHIRSGYEYAGSGEVSMDPSSASGTRQLPTILDIAILDDIGYSVNYAAATANPTNNRDSLQPRIYAHCGCLGCQLNSNKVTQIPGTIGSSQLIDSVLSA
jgi:hypothetical protein